MLDGVRRHGIGIGGGHGAKDAVHDEFWIMNEMGSDASGLCRSSFDALSSELNLVV